MSSPIEDFIVSLGFDTTKIKSQIQDLHKSLEKLAVGVDAKRVKNGLKAEKQISDNAIKVAETTAKKKEDIEKKTVKQSIALQDGHVKAQIKLQEKLAKQKAKDFNLVEKALQKTQKKALERQEALYRLNNKAKPSQNPSQSFIESAKRQQAVRALLNNEQNPQLKAMGNYYRKMQSDQSALGIANERLRKRRSLGTLTNLQAFRDLKSSGPEGRQQALQALLSARQAARGGSLEKIKAIRASVIKLNRDLKESNVRVATLMTGPTGSATNNTFNAIKKGGGFQNYTSQQQASLLQGAQKQTTQKGADAFVRAARDVERYRPLGGAKIDAAIASGNIDQLRTVTKELSRMNHELEKQRRHSIGAAAAMSSLQDSTRNTVREYASLYALFAGTNYFKEQVKALDAMGAGLSAVSANSEEAASNIEYLKGIIVKNGLSLKDTTKDFVKLRAAMKGEFNLEQTRQAFESITMSGKILQMSQSELALTTKAITQMFGKEGIRAEELTGQLGDHMPIAMQALQKATGKTSKELFKMMQQGEVGMKYILPFTKAMEDLLDVNGAYAKSLDKLGNVEDSMKSAFSVIAAENLDKGGFTEGLKNFYKTITKLITENEDTLERLGRIYKKVFDGLSVVVRGATQWFASFLRAVETVGQAVGWFVDNPLTSLIIAMPILTANMKNLGKVMAAAFRTPLVILTTIVGVLDEIRAYFDDDVVGLFDDKGWSEEQSKKVHAQRRVMMGMGTAEDAKLVGSDFTVGPLAQFGQDIAKNMPVASQTQHGSVILSALEGFAKTSFDYTMAGLKDFTSWYSKNTIGGQISITINSPDPEKAGESVKKELERMTDLQAVGAR